MNCVGELQRVLHQCCGILVKPLSAFFGHPPFDFIFKFLLMAFFSHDLGQLSHPFPLSQQAAGYICLCCSALQNCCLYNVHHFLQHTQCLQLAVRCFGSFQGELYCAQDASSGGWSAFSRLYCRNAFAVGWSRTFQSDEQRVERVYWTILNVSIHMQSLMLYSLFFTSGVKGSKNTTHVCRILLKTSVDSLLTSSPVFEASWTSPPSLLRLLQIQARIR